MLEEIYRFGNPECIQSAYQVYSDVLREKKDNLISILKSKYYIYEKEKKYEEQKKIIELLSDIPNCEDIIRELYNYSEDIYDKKKEEKSKVKNDPLYYDPLLRMGRQFKALFFGY